MFGRKKRNREAAEQTLTESTTESAATEAAPEQEAQDPRAYGPWDESELPGERDEYLDLGVVLLKAVAGVNVRLELDPRDRVPRAVNMDFAGGSVQVQVFTAPKSSGLWDEVRAELVAGLRRDGGEPTVSDGPLGMQVNARFAGLTPSGEDGFRLARFVGIDGPRWFLRCVYTGDAARPGSPPAAWPGAAHDPGGRRGAPRGCADRRGRRRGPDPGRAGPRGAGAAARP